jgi:hypothetical protein
MTGKGEEGQFRRHRRCSGALLRLDQAGIATPTMIGWPAPPRFTIQFTSTWCPWANAVEGFFAKLTR